MWGKKKKTNEEMEQSERREIQVFCKTHSNSKKKKILSKQLFEDTK